jgi:hypothetical protein
MLRRVTILRNYSWIFVSTSPSIRKAPTSFLFECKKATAARFDAMCAQSAAELPRWGVPRKAIDFVRCCSDSDRKRAWTRHYWHR